MISLKCNMVVILFVVLKWFDKTRNAHSDSLHTVSTNHFTNPTLVTGANVMLCLQRKLLKMFFSGS